MEPDKKPFKDQQACLFGVGLDMSNQNFMETRLDAYMDLINEDIKNEYNSTESERFKSMRCSQDTVKFMQYLQNTESMSRIVGPDYLPKIKTILDHYTKIINDFLSKI